MSTRRSFFAFRVFSGECNKLARVQETRPSSFKSLQQTRPQVRRPGNRVHKPLRHAPGAGARRGTAHEAKDGPRRAGPAGPHEPRRAGAAAHELQVSGASVGCATKHGIPSFFPSVQPVLAVHHGSVRVNRRSGSTQPVVAARPFRRHMLCSRAHPVLCASPCNIRVPGGDVEFSGAGSSRRRWRTRPKSTRRRTLRA